MERITVSTGGFLVGPVKLPGPQPIYIVNNGSQAQAFTLQPVATSYVASGKSTFCLPTATPVTWFKTDQRVTVPAGRTIMVPVRVTGQHKGVDVAIAVRPVTAPGSGVAVSYTAYAQEIIGGTTASGCAHIRGVATTVAPPSIPVAPIAGGAGGFLALAVAAAVIYRRRYPKRGSHHHNRRGVHA